MTLPLTKLTPPPPLENGARLSRAEFERRYQPISDLKKAELIEGIVYMPSPVKHTSHSRPQATLITLFGTYVAATPGIDFGDNVTVRLDLDNEPQPDAFLMIRPECGGQARIDKDDYIEGAPELIAEIAATSASYDLHQKLHAYRRNGVREYLVWRTFDNEIDYFILREGRFDRVAADASGILRSEVFPGLQIDAPALLRNDMPAALQSLQAGLAAPEHAAFVQQLQAPRGR